ncbi:antibiotic biosynthesis monooxygenase family protein [Piscinibacter sp.]|jgi:heme-degrading monooxygenase HmoA|uniref:antibiotic biosynthesis monooxygenase family protein n=1 Tax=Piscinibacter sp. TaxID=1903157 RepID=UPI003559ED77
MVVTIFRSRLRADADLKALEAAGGRMYELASGMPGFVSYKDYTAQDGESVAIVEFTDEASLLAWRNHPEHRQMQERGRTEFMSEYRIQVCNSLRDYSFSAGS